jgi:hypothetical protein
MPECLLPVVHRLAFVKGKPRALCDKKSRKNLVPLVALVTCPNCAEKRLAPSWC